MFEENEQLSEILGKSFIHLSVDVTKDENDPLIEKYDVKLPGIPHLTVLDAGGAVLANVKLGRQFYVKGSLDARLIRGFLEKYPHTEPNV